MTHKSKKDDGYKKLAESIKTGDIGKLYIFHGDERYLLERSLSDLRRCLCPYGLSGFNYKRFEGKNISADLLEEAVDALPSFASRTLIEIHDFDIFKSDNKQHLLKILSELPDYVCVLLVYTSMIFKPDRRVKADAELLKLAEVIEFSVQEQDKLVKWIRLHFRDAGKNIAVKDAEYLAFITGGYMSVLYGEIGKTAAYAKGDTVTRADIDAVVVPILDTVAYKLTDAIARREHAGALTIMDELLQMKEAPHKLLFSIALKMRQLLAARVLIENRLGKNELMDICSIKHEFQARSLIDTARVMTLEKCRDAVLHCSQTAYDLNSSPEPEARLTELILKLALK